MHYVAILYLEFYHHFHQHVRLPPILFPQINAIHQLFRVYS